jgi:ornithine carbamoyltransferase
MNPQLHPAPSCPHAAASAGGSDAGQGAAPTAQGGAAHCRLLSTLKGRNLALLCDDPAQPEALLAYRAAIDLGAHVALVRPRFGEGEQTDPLPETARMLGRLYDGIVCVAVTGELVDRLRPLAGIPVLDDAAICIHTADAPACTCAAAHAALSDEQRLELWQAALVQSLG